MNINELKNELTKLKDEKYNLLKLINHDIRSPFNRVFALLQLFEMESKEISSIQKEYINSMYLSILSGLEMITNLRDMREIDAGYIKIDKNEFDLVEIVKKSIKTFYKQTEIKALKIHTRFSMEKAPIISDEYFVQRVIENVLSNAIKFSKEEEDIHVELKKDKSNYRISIRDFGDGIILEEEPLLYERFKKLSSIATGGEGSLGIGLHNTRYFLNELNGKINFQRSDKPGNTFVIRLPVE